MTFKVIDTKTGKEPTDRVIHNIAKKGNLMTMDIDQFYVGEDDRLYLLMIAETSHIAILKDSRLSYRKARARNEHI